ncbi:MAG TPA: queuosine salvage family protein [Ktedonobacteraceae bacterium]|jgi:Potential Queuosine, Q, salvage protein family|nr:queuosine salvage family protein [Ktedonobacteraceae bacterium]
MAEILQTNDFEDEDPYLLSQVDTLGVLSSTRQVVEQGEYVWIDLEEIKLLVHQWIQHSKASAITPPSWYEQYHFFDGTERTVNWILALDALNFCFWAEKDQPRWTIEYHGETLNGYMAEAAALKRAVEEDDIPLWDATYLSTISEKTLAHIFRGEQTIPLFEQRLQNIREVGRILLAHFDGQFIHAIEQAEHNAVKLALLLAQDFPSFNDIAFYRNQKICFFKRAQICVADLYGVFGGKSWGAFTDLHQLTAFADYKLPQVLRHLKVLEYHPTLAKRIDNQELLEAGSEEEIELRASTVWACELLRREMMHQDHPVTAAEIDLRLWLLGQQSNEMRPYHRTRTIYY